MDLDPRMSQLGISVLGNMSFWSYWVRILKNSVWNVRRFYTKLDSNGTAYGAFLKRFDITDSLQDPIRKLSAVMTGVAEIKCRRGWQC